MQRTTGQVPRLFERLLQDGGISREAYDGAMRHHHRTGAHPHESLIEVSATSESELLKYLARTYHTRFVSTERLARADVDARVLQKVPQKVAERLNVFPVLFNAESGELSVVTSDFDDDIAKHVQLASGHRLVKVYVGRAAAVRAAIRKHYGGDSFAFSGLLGAAAQAYGSKFDVVDRRLHTEETMLTRMNERVLSEDDFERRPIGLPTTDIRPSVPPMPTFDSAASPQNAASAQHSILPMPQTIPGPYAPAHSPLPPLASQASFANLSLGALASTHAMPISSLPLPISSQLGPAPSFAATDVLPVLIALLESGRGDLRGHSSQVARYVRQLCERIGLSPVEVEGAVIAAYLHDLGKPPTLHLTPLNVAEYESHRSHAVKSYLAPMRLFEGIALPKASVDALTHLYERFDGEGFPDRIGGKEIPLGARVLAIVETFCDLIQNPRNPYRKTLTPSEACGVLSSQRSRIFDPNLVELFRSSVLGEDLRKRLLETRHEILLVDPDAEETTVLELRLVEQGYEVAIARSSEDALRILASKDVDLVITEIELPDYDGFSLLEQMRLLPESAETPVLFLTGRSDRESVHHGFSLGAVDYLIKPASSDVCVAKVKQVLEGVRRSRVPRGVMGSLEEMTLTELVQILANGRRSGVLRLSSGGLVGEVQIDAGEIHHAKWAEHAGEEALFRMLWLTSGNFALDPTRKPDTRSIYAPTESLLLDAMRKQDEARR